MTEISTHLTLQKYLWTSRTEMSIRAHYQDAKVLIRFASGVFRKIYIFHMNVQTHCLMTKVWQRLSFRSIWCKDPPPGPIHMFSWPMKHNLTWLMSLYINIFVVQRKLVVWTCGTRHTTASVHAEIQALKLTSYVGREKWCNRRIGLSLQSYDCHTPSCSGFWASASWFRHCPTCSGRRHKQGCWESMVGQRNPVNNST